MKLRFFNGLDRENGTAHQAQIRLNLLKYSGEWSFFNKNNSPIHETNELKCWFNNQESDDIIIALFHFTQIKNIVDLVDKWQETVRNKTFALLISGGGGTDDMTDAANQLSNKGFAGSAALKEAFDKLAVTNSWGNFLAEFQAEKHLELDKAKKIFQKWIPIINGNGEIEIPIQPGPHNSYTRSSATQRASYQQVNPLHIGNALLDLLEVVSTLNDDSAPAEAISKVKDIEWWKGKKIFRNYTQADAIKIIELFANNYIQGVELSQVRPFVVALTQDDSQGQPLELDIINLATQAYNAFNPSNQR